jgi:HEPN domain-containing protein
LNRFQWQQLAERWLVDAKGLLDDHRWSAAYYLSGYAVECGLKACVLLRVATTPEVIFESRRFSDQCWTHDLLDLVKHANLETVRLSDLAANHALRRNWLVVSYWTEQARYLTTPHHQAKKLYAAIANDPHGVMPWIRNRW